MNDVKTHPTLEASENGLPNSIGNAEEHEARRLQRLLDQHQATWDGPNDPRDPYNWTVVQKLSIGVLISLGQLIAYMSASLIAPALGIIELDVDISAITAQVIMLITFLGFALGPFLLAPLAESYGRRPVWMAGNLWFVLWNAVVPLGKLKELMIFARFMAGIGSSASITLAFPIMADMFREADRGKSMAIVALLTYAGPALGPIVGGIVTQLLRWEWAFWLLSIIDAIVVLVGFCFLDETYTPVLLRRKYSMPGTPPTVHQNFFRKYRNGVRGSRTQPDLLQTLVRPFRLYWTRPVIFVVAGLLALDMGVYCLMLSSLSNLWINKYHSSELKSSLHYIAVAIGATINGQFGSYLMDRLYIHLKGRNGGTGEPEFRVPYLVPGLILMPAGLLWYGWSAQHTLPWIMVDVGVAVFTLGSFTTAQAVNAYQLDEFDEHGASAMAASCLLQNVIGFALPIFAPQMYEAMGYGWGNSLIALIMLGLGLPMAAVLWFWGRRLRAIGRVEKHEDEEEVE